MKKILFTLILFITSCGYQPIYIGQGQENLTFQKITLNGEKKINQKIINSLKFKQNKNSSLRNELILNSNYKIEETSKNSKGQVISYRSKIQVNLIIKKENEIIKSKNFTQDFSYNSLDNKFELTEYQNEIKNNLINKVIEEIIIYINL
tara:strand:- start:1847 stop:2293 length:447 start_codon:yes stop_codon:yes gene_type:complete